MAIGYLGWSALNPGPASFTDLMQRLLVVLLVALPSGYLANHLLEEITATRRERDEAQRRSSLLRAAALGGRRSTSLDVDEVLDTLRATVTQIGFAEPTVFEIEGPAERPPRRPARARTRGGSSASHPAIPASWPARGPATPAGR